MRYLIALLALAGVVVSSMALHIHYMDSSAVPPCSVSEHWDCGSVNRGAFSVIPPSHFDERPGTLHVPVAILGIAGYTLIVLFSLAARLRIVLILALGGFLFAIRLTYVEAYIIKTWCIYCVWSQSLIAAILLATAAAMLLRRNAKFRSMSDGLAASKPW